MLDTRPGLAADPAALRRSAFAELKLAAGATRISPLPPAGRFILRARDAAIDLAGTTFGVALPRQACRSASSGSRAALWLGPDEWLLLADPEEGAAVEEALEAALAGTRHSLVEISHRNAGFALTGPGAATALNAGCPLDLDLAAFPVGMCTRTIFAKAEIVLWRTDAARFHVELGRSFVCYVTQYLEEVLSELEAG